MSAQTNDINNTKGTNDLINAGNSPSVNSLSAPKVNHLVSFAHGLGLNTKRTENGSLLIDAGIDSYGSIEAGRQIAEICLGGLATARLRAARDYQNWPWHVDVHTSHPVIACLASQYAGWSLSHGQGKSTFNALGSGPARALGSREPLLAEIGYRDEADATCIVLEVDRIPPVEIADKIAERCRVMPENLTLILTPTSSLAGAVQVVARVFESALHKAHTLNFPLDEIVDGMGTVPLCPPSPDFLTAMSRTNDAILFGGHVHLFISSGDEDAEDLARRLPSNTSQDYGRPFAEVFKDANFDFYKLDPMLFSPARVTVSSLRTGHSFQAGDVNMQALNTSFTSIFS
ncbi:MAG: methenyltetrahydromethanopterin cyclohydrolase [Gammaproteobacteria bacterium]|nr:methenyltetrahydromethanopterin cyclohydrolase [Gammaproteobacteria bacterium]